MLRNVSRNLIFLAVLILFASSVCFGGYKAVRITYTISGSTGIDGVVMEGLPGDPVCDADGFYSVTVDYGWAGNVTPVKQGFEFSPAERNYAKVVGNQASQNYRGSLLKYTISGSAGVIGAILEGLDGEVYSDKNGNYTATVNYGWSGVVTPVKEGYDFYPQYYEYEFVRGDEKNQAFVAELKTFVISGSTNLGGVVLKGFPDAAISDNVGDYSVTVDYGWNGHVTAVLEGYTFEPASTMYSKTVADHFRQDYAADRIILTISGNAGQSGVTMNGLGVNTVSDARGNYSAKVDYDFSGTVRPSKKGYNFMPAKVDYTNLKRDKVNDRYAAKLKTYTISGSAGMGGVVMKGLAGSPITKSDGSYSVQVNYGWKGVVTATKKGYSFDPAEMAYEDISANQSDQDYAGEILSYIVSGVVSSDGSPIGGVVLNGLPGGPVTDEDGFYSVIVDYGWTGGVEPTKKGHTFKPESFAYRHVMKDYPQNYEATLFQFAVSGVITAGGQPLKGVVVKADKGGGSGTTNGNGEYKLFVDYGFSGSVRPEKDGYTFEPSNRFTKVTEMASEREYSDVVENQAKQDYAGTILTFSIIGTVAINGEPVEGVLMTVNNGGGTSLTDSYGKYSLRVDYGWSGDVSPSKEGYMFNPPSIEYVNVTSDIDEDVREIERDASRKAAQELATSRKQARELKAARKKAEEAEASREAMEELKAEREAAQEVKASRAAIEELEAARKAAKEVKGTREAMDELKAARKAVEELEAARKSLEDVKSSRAAVEELEASRKALEELKAEREAMDELETARKALEELEAIIGGKSVGEKAPEGDMGAKVLTGDLPGRGVKLDVCIAVMDHSDLVGMKYEWGGAKVEAGLVADLSEKACDVQAGSANKPWGIQIGRLFGKASSGTLAGILSGLEQAGKADIISSPEVLAREGEATEIKVTTEKYYFVDDASAEIGGNAADDPDVEKVEYQTSLNITPHVSPSGDIMLTLAIEVSEVAILGEDSQVIARCVVNDTVLIKDGGTVLVAGLKNDDVSDSENDADGDEVVIFITGRSLSR